MTIFQQKEKKDILDKLLPYLEKHPEDAPDFLNAITTALKSYKEGVAKQRSNLAQNALGFVISQTTEESYKRWKKAPVDMKIPMMIDAVFYLVPGGKIHNHSSAELKAIQMFRQWCLDEQVLTNEKWYSWLRNTKGEEYYQWMINLLN